MSKSKSIAAPGKDFEMPPGAWPQDWPPQWQEQLGDAWLADTAGDKTYERALPYFMSGEIEVLERSDALPAPAIRAQVQGTELYQTQMSFEDEGLAGDCSCPHAADGYFCKHQVALTLIWRALIAGQKLAVDSEAQKKVAAVAKRAATSLENAKTLQAFVQAQSAHDLANKLLEWADQVTELKRDLKAWHQLATTGSDIKSLKSTVTALLRAPQFLGRHESTSYSFEARRVLPLLGSAIKKNPADGLTLSEHAYLRIHTIMGQADDSDGAIGDVAIEIGKLWIKALQAAGPQAASFGDRYAALRDAEIFQAIDHDDAVKAMGEAASQRYLKHTREVWEAALARVQTTAPAGKREAKRYRADDFDISLFSAQIRYLEHLRSLGDTPEVLRVLRSKLTESGDYNMLIRELQQQGQHREALAAAQEGAKRFPDDWGLEGTLIALYERDGWDAEALALYRKRFDRHPTAALFFAVLEACKRAAADVSQERLQLWQSLINAEKVAFAKAGKHGLYGQEQTGPNTSLRVEILLTEKAVDAAFDLAQPPNMVEESLLLALAKSLSAKREADALPILLRVFENRMRYAQTPYAAELMLAGDIVRQMDTDAANAWLANLRVQFKTKRNFIAGLANIAGKAAR
jgi:SWIM zinc finger